jgi:plastocyanin
MKPCVSRWAALACLILAGCSTGKDLPQSTRTGIIRDVKIADVLHPKELQVRVGDEVRWVNARNASVKVVFVHPLRDKVSCQNRFITTGLRGMFSSDSNEISTTTIDSNEYASLCFSSPAVYTYNIRMESPAPGGEMNTTGRILVE